MTLEFDLRCGFAQAEDKIGELLIPRGKNGFNKYPLGDAKKDGEPVELVGLPFNELYADWERYSLESPPGLVLLPGQLLLLCLFVYCKNTRVRYALHEKVGHKVSTGH